MRSMLLMFCVVRNNIFDKRCKWLPFPHFLYFDNQPLLTAGFLIQIFSHLRGIAQTSGALTVKSKVEGSNPSAPTNNGLCFCL